MKTCLIVIYNNNYESNIEKVERLHKERFSKIFHLMPFYTGNKENVIKVYGSSYHFQGYVNYGLEAFINDDYTHYCFVADDMILNPELNENNFDEYLGLDADSGFLPSIKAIDYELILDWRWAYTSYFAMLYSQNACEFEKFIPSKEQAQMLFEKHNLDSKNISARSFKLIQNYYDKNLTNYHDYILKDINKDNILKVLKMNKPTDSLYPLAASYSDIFVIPHKKIREFTNLCSIFESVRVFVEVAIPTAMALSLDKIVTLNDINKGMATFTEPEVLDEFCQKYNYSLTTLYNIWNNFGISMHPIKLSKWKFDDEK